MSIRAKRDCESYSQELLRAIKEGRNNHAKVLLQQKQNALDCIDSSRKTLLHHAVKHRNKSIVRHLIRQGWSIDVEDKFGVTPVLIAVQKRDYEIVDLLVNYGADIYLPDYSGMSPLHYVARKCICVEPNKLELADRAILERFFRIINMDFFLNKSLLIQTLMGENSVVKVAAVVHGDEKLTKYMLENDNVIDYHVDQYGHTPLHCAIILARPVNAKMLIERGANVHAENAMGHTPLSYYVSKFEDGDENSQVLKSLLTTGQENNSSIRHKSSELEQLLTNGNEETVKTVLQSGIVLPKTFQLNRTILFLLAINKNEDVIGLLEEFSIEFDVNARDTQGSTALYCAANRLRVKQVEFLLERGADVNLKLHTGGTVLESVLTSCYFDYSSERQIDSEIIVMKLLQHGAIVGKLEVYSIKNKRLSSIIMTSHLALLEVLDVSPDTCIYPDYYEEHFDWCIRQLLVMKTIQVYGQVTLFQLLTESDWKILAYARHSEFVWRFNYVMENIDCIEFYYFDTLNKRIVQALETIELNGKAAPIIEELTGLCSDVYHLIVFKIIGYLNVYDLRNLCKIDVICCMEE